MKKKVLVRILLKQMRLCQTSLNCLEHVCRTESHQEDDDDPDTPQRVPGGHPKEQDLKFRREVQ